MRMQVTHPGNPTLLNNLAYASDLPGKADEALAVLKDMPEVSGLEDAARKCVLLRARGLCAFFGRRRVETGRSLCERRWRWQ